LAPHAADRAIASAVPGSEVRLSIDAELQKNLEELARERLRTLAATLGPDVSLAMIVVDNATGEVRVRVGSPAYFDVRRAGQVDMTRAQRSPGSTLKPFIYGLGFEDGLIHPETLIDDRPARFGDYAPQNFDFTFHGTVTVRKALQLSLNLPALAVLDRVGTSRFIARLGQTGAMLALPDGQPPSLAIGLGGVGIRLSDLTMLYAGLARLGSVLPLRETSGPSAGDGNRLMTPVAAWYVSNILAGTPPPENGITGRIAFKTGTSYGYRDAWSVGFDGKHTIGVWVGRPDGAPVPGLFGRAAAAPILFDAFARLLGTAAPLPRAPEGVLTATGARLPPPLRHFPPGARGESAQARLHILFPPDGARLELRMSDEQADSIPLKVIGAVVPLTVLINGMPAHLQSRGDLSFKPAGPGFARVTVIDGAGAMDSVLLRLEAPSAAMATTPTAH
jgi:penicillin-binding protein 1C